jgi:hypothetical protein
MQLAWEVGGGGATTGRGSDLGGGDRAVGALGVVGPLHEIEVLAEALRHLARGSGGSVMTAASVRLCKLPTPSILPQSALIWPVPLWVVRLRTNPGGQRAPASCLLGRVRGLDLLLRD